MTTSGRGLKSVVRRGASFFVRPIWRRIWARVEGRVQITDAHLRDLAHHVASVEAQVSAHAERLAGVDGRLAGMDGRLGSAEAQIADLGARLRGLEELTLAGRIGGLEADVANLWRDFSGAAGEVAAVRAFTTHVERKLSLVETGWRQHGPAFVAAVASVTALEQDVAKIQAAHGGGAIHDDASPSEIRAQ